MKTYDFAQSRLPPILYSVDDHAGRRGYQRIRDTFGQFQFFFFYLFIYLTLYHGGFRYARGKIIQLSCLTTMRSRRLRYSIYSGFNARTLLLRQIHGTCTCMCFDFLDVSDSHIAFYSDNVFIRARVFKTRRKSVFIIDRFH